MSSDFFDVAKLTGSGSSKVSMLSAAMGSGPAVVSGLLALLGEGSFISDAGVAGEGFPVRWAGAGPSFGVALFCGCRAGEGFADLGGGSGGGGISDNVSGETEPFSESVMAFADELEALLDGSARRGSFNA